MKSGKSTFMKLVADHEKIMKAVSLWASPDEVIIASHYFWKAGDSMQRSQAGFLRGLLYDILRQRPHITRAICGGQWSASVPNAHLRSWTLKDLQQSFDALSTSNSLRLKIVLFVDGLDEYEGDHVDLCLFLKDLARNSSNIKICAASRPENAFEDSFGSNIPHRINIHDLTRNDILRYSQSRLTEHPRWTQIIKESQDLQTTCQDIANRARGVFLWVKLVTQSLRDGMTDYNTVDEMKSRLDSLPSDMESLYRHLLLSVDPQYHQKMAETLLMKSDMTSHQWWEVFAMHEESYKDDRYALKLAPPTVSVYAWESVSKDVQDASERTILSRRIMSRCRGILEVHNEDIEWIHRTAHDFVKTSEMRNYLKEKCRPNFDAAIAELGARVACIITIDGIPSDLHRLRMASLLAQNRSSLLNFFSNLTRRVWDSSGALLLDIENEQEAFKLLDRLAQKLLPCTDCTDGEISSVLYQYVPTLSPFRWRHHRLTRPIDSGLVPEFVLVHSPRYSLHKLRINSRYFRSSIIPALQFPLQQRAIHGGADRTELILEMLKHGYELNRGFLFDHESIAHGFDRKSEDFECDDQLHYVKTPWISYIESISLSSAYVPSRLIEEILHQYMWQYCDISTEDLFGSQLLAQTKRRLNRFKQDLSSGFLFTLLQHGADPNAQSTPFTTAWTSFVCAGITQPELLQAEDAYLTALDVFLQNGTDLGASTIGLTLDPGSTCTRLPWKMITGWEMFCEHLEHETLKHEDAKMLLFIARIATRMIKYAVDTQWPLGRLPDILAKVFPDDLRLPMMQLIEQGGGESRKRGAEYSPDMDRQRKQPRIEDVTEIDGI
jgi:hypothetical protein